MKKNEKQAHDFSLFRYNRGVGRRGAARGRLVEAIGRADGAIGNRRGKRKLLLAALTKSK